MKALKYLNKFYIKYKYHLLWGSLFVVISNIFAIVPAQIIRYAFDLVKDTIDVFFIYDKFNIQGGIYSIFAQSILVYGVIIFLMALLRGIFLFFMRQTIIVMSRLVEFDMKNEIYEHYQTLPLSFYRKNNTGDLMARISEDVGNVRMYLGPAIMYGINLIVLFVLVISYMLSVNMKLTFYVLAPLPLLSVSIYYVNNIINKRSEEIQKKLSGLSTFVQEAFSGIRVLKAFAREKDSGNKFQGASEQYKKSFLRLTVVNALFFPLVAGLIGISVIITIYAGGLQVMDGTLSIGNIAEFILYVNILTWPVTSLGWTISIIQRAEASQKRINEFLDTKTDIVSEKNLIRPLQGNIKFQHVTFTYPDSGIVALKDVSFEVKAGESIAILGSTGSGKSTIANLLCRMYDTTIGEISIDDENIKNFNVSDFRSQIGYVPQDVFLFSDSIKNNIAFGLEKMTEEKMIKAAKEADLYNNIVDFPEGFNTVLGERGITLSGGQKQRLSIARAIVRDPKILILDDCLSAVDTKTENAILNNLKDIMKDKTSIIISHRVSSAKLADKIIVLADGELIEQGSHEDLMKLNKVYKELYEKQLVEGV